MLNMYVHECYVILNKILLLLNSIFKCRKFSLFFSLLFLLLILLLPSLFYYSSIDISAVTWNGNKMRWYVAVAVWSLIVLFFYFTFYTQSEYESLKQWNYLSIRSLYSCQSYVDDWFLAQREDVELKRLKVQCSCVKIIINS